MPQIELTQNTVSPWKVIFCVNSIYGIAVLYHDSYASYATDWVHNSDATDWVIAKHGIPLKGHTVKSFSALYNADTITDSSFGPRNDKNSTFPNPGNTDSSVRHRKPTLGSVPFVSVLTRLTIRDPFFWWDETFNGGRCLWVVLLHVYICFGSLFWNFNFPLSLGTVRSVKYTVKK